MQKKTKILKQWRREKNMKMSVLKDTFFKVIKCGKNLKIDRNNEAKQAEIRQQVDKKKNQLEILKMNNIVIKI